jgi:hypothetical protein
MQGPAASVVATCPDSPLNQLSLATFQLVNELLTNWKLPAHGPDEAACSTPATSSRAGDRQSAKDTPSSDSIGETLATPPGLLTVITPLVAIVILAGRPPLAVAASRTVCAGR